MWCAKISQFLQAGQNFKLKRERVGINLYPLLPSFWHGMSPVEKRKVAAVVEKHNGYTVECCEELRDSCRVLVRDMQHLRVCLECAKKNPAQLDI